MIRGNRRKSSYKKNIFYKKKKSKKNKMLLTSLVFLCGLMVGFILMDENKALSDVEGNKDIAIANKEANNNEANNAPIEAKEEKTEKKDSILTEEEIKMVKEALTTDSSELLKLVNKENLLSSDYIPENLTTPNINLQQSSQDEQSLVREEMVDDLEAMFNDATEKGFQIFLNSGFRSYSLQTYLYKSDLERHGTSTSEFVAQPGASEHQLGYAVDITSQNVGFALVQKFEDTEEGKWLIENAHKYGFILRYGKEKEAITGYKYEPWHYRYLGNKEISRICYEKNLTLEELLNLVKSE